MTALRSLTPFFVFAAVYAVIGLVVTNSYYQLIMTLVLVWASFGLSWNILSGYTGLVSFGHAAFFGIGAYASALLTLRLEWSPWLGLVAVIVLFASFLGYFTGSVTIGLVAMVVSVFALLYLFAISARLAPSPA